jgi:penicillin-binding protein 1A
LSRERSFARKAREAVLAVLLELKLSKTEVMETYLNEVPLGHGTIGVEAAARFYFEKGAHELSWGEGAVLAALTTNAKNR